MAGKIKAIEPRSSKGAIQQPPAVILKPQRTIELPNPVRALALGRNGHLIPKRPLRAEIILHRRNQRPRNPAPAPFGQEIRPGAV